MLIVGSKNTWGKYLVRMIKALFGVPFDFRQQQHARFFLKKTLSFLSTTFSHNFHILFVFSICETYYL
jgi:hypothetical protein